MITYLVCELRFPCPVAKNDRFVLKVKGKR
jgi:hypothetical protein